MKFNCTLILIVLFTVFGCRSYESEQYYDIENEAIKEIIPQLVDLENMLSWNDYGVGTPRLYLISKLDTSVSLQADIDEMLRSQSKNGFFVESEWTKDSMEEEAVFQPFKKGLIKERTLTTNFDYENLKIEKITQEEFDKVLSEGLIEKMINDRTIFGYLSISRISFDKDFSVGYLSYTFHCGEACYWWSNIKIQKKDGKWTVEKSYTGGIANNADSSFQHKPAIG